MTEDEQQKTYGMCRCGEPITEHDIEQGHCIACGRRILPAAAEKYYD